jgi:GntR family transcriptional regulator
MIHERDTMTSTGDEPVYEPARGTGRAGLLLTSVRQAYELLRSGIFDGHFPEGHKFDEVATMRDLFATRSAVRGALGMLADEGLVVRRQQSGTTVVRVMTPVPVQQFLGPADENAVMKDVEYRDVSYRRVSAPELVRRGLAIEDEEVVCSERVILVGGEPFELRVSYFPVWDDPLRPYGPVSRYPELPDFEERFARAFGSEFGRSHVTISSVAGEERTCGLLGVATGTPLLLRTMRMIDASERVREINFSYHRGDRVVFVA